MKRRVALATQAVGASLRDPVVPSERRAQRRGQSILKKTDK